MAKIILKEQTLPATPSSGDSVVYVDTADSKLKLVDDAGTETVMASEAYVSALPRVHVGGTGEDGVQGDADLTITGSNNTYIVKNFSSWTAGSVARTCTITPTNCITHIKIKGDADFTNWTFNFAAKGAAGGAQVAEATNGNIGTVGNCDNVAMVCAAGIGGTQRTLSATAASVKASNTLLTSNINLFSNILFCGAGGGSGGGGTASMGAGTGGAGGIGGGCLIIEVGGNVTLSSTVITVAGGVGSVGGSASSNSGSGGGGGGGAGGTFYMFYSGTYTGSVTPTVVGGAGGAGGTGGGNIGGAGGSGGATIFVGGSTGAGALGGANNCNGGAGGAGAVGYYLIEKI